MDLAQLGPDEVRAWLADHGYGGRIGLAPSGTWARGTGNLTGLALARVAGDEGGRGQGGMRGKTSPAAFIDPVRLTEDDERALADWLGDESAAKAMHDAKGPIHALASRGWALRGLTSDTALAAYLALPGQRSFDLADLALRYTKHQLGDAGETATGQLTLDMATEDAEDAEAQAAMSLAERALATAELADALDADLVKRGAAELLADVELPLVTVLAKMEHAGIAADIEHFASMSASLGADVKAAEQGAYAATGHEFNLGLAQAAAGSAVHRARPAEDQADQDRLHDRLRGADRPAGADRAPGARAPAQAPRRGQAEEHRRFTHSDGRSGWPYPHHLQPDDRGDRPAELDRSESAEHPDQDRGRPRIRQGFVVGKGYECLLTADYSQIELRIMAHLSGDEALAAAFGSGHDFHAATASRVFGLPPEDITGDLRSKIKAMNYGLAYGLSVYGLSQQLSVSAAEAGGYMDEYFAVFGGVRDYLQDVVAQARQDGYTQTILGRRRYLPDLTSDNRQRRQMAERMALNAPIQGSAADIIKVAMLAVDEATGDQRADFEDAAAGSRRTFVRGRAGRT